jgi:hypothetical protein
MRHQTGQRTATAGVCTATGRGDARQAWRGRGETLRMGRSLAPVVAFVGLLSWAGTAPALAIAQAGGETGIPGLMLAAVGPPNNGGGGGGVPDPTWRSLPGFVKSIFRQHLRPGYFNPLRQPPSDQPAIGHGGGGEGGGGAGRMRAGPNSND